jgi:hypothetical protein
MRALLPPLSATPSIDRLPDLGSMPKGRQLYGELERVCLDFTPLHPIIKNCTTIAVMENAIASQSVEVRESWRLLQQVLRFSQCNWMRLARDTEYRVLDDMVHEAKELTEPNAKIIALLSRQEPKHLYAWGRVITTPGDFPEAPLAPLEQLKAFHPGRDIYYLSPILVDPRTYRLIGETVDPNVLLLNSLREIAPEGIFLTRIGEANTGSRQTFTKLGFLPTEYLTPFSNHPYRWYVMTPESFAGSLRVCKADEKVRRAQQLVKDLVGADHSQKGPMLIAGPRNPVVDLAGEIAIGSPDRKVLCLIEDNQRAPREQGNLRYVSMDAGYEYWLRARYEEAILLPKIFRFLGDMPEKPFSDCVFDTVVAVAQDFGQSPGQSILPMKYYDHLSRLGRFIGIIVSSECPSNRLTPERVPFLYEHQGIFPLNWQGRTFWYSRLQDVRDEATEAFLQAGRQLTSGSL